jgi:hypothetical protein
VWRYFLYRLSSVDFWTVTIPSWKIRLPIVDFRWLELLAQGINSQWIENYKILVLMHGTLPGFDDDLFFDRPQSDNMLRLAKLDLPCQDIFFIAGQANRFVRFFEQPHRHPTLSLAINFPYRSPGYIFLQPLIMRLEVLLPIMDLDKRWGLLFLADALQTIIVWFWIPHIEISSGPLPMAHQNLTIDVKNPTRLHLRKPFGQRHSLIVHFCRQEYIFY